MATGFLRAQLLISALQRVAKLVASPMTYCFQRWLWKPSATASIPKRDSGETHSCCCVCLSDCAAEQLHTFAAWGGCKHGVCDDCRKGLLDHAIQTGTAACPRCNSAIPQRIMTLMAGERQEELEAAQLATACQSFVKCPKCAHIQFAREDDQTRGPLEVACAECNFSFCLRCREPYHHMNCAGRDCEEVVREKRAAWLQWQAEGQAAFVERMKAEDKAYVARLQQLKGDRVVQQRALEAFKEDESCKRSWRHCPNCNAVWAGTDACPEVTCGVLEASMGGQRGVVGCGKRFNFLREGRPYRPARVPDVADVHVSPRLMAAVHHGEWCSLCDGDIHGVRFRCLHCPHYNLCLDCLLEQGAWHEAEAALLGTTCANQRHVFEILFEPLS
eukprot:TRINITY_DN47197_c0_g1_i1.p1 TRINITY_DN47197_c0_g1~~TRINITY_DN47197_c0_g1_i1.p1  ORF type:complete len:388 (-),score=65.49 TRINITY_DN47197_c0_g1_i1:57-1220(-)